MSKNSKRTLLIYLLFFLATVPSSCATKGEKFESHTVKINETYMIQANAFYDHSQFLSGGLYEFKVIKNQTQFDNTILTFRHDDPNPIPKNQIIVENKNLAYFWMGWKFGSTSDGGITWSTCDATDFYQHGTNHGLIDNVEIDANGNGKMFLNENGTERIGAPFLETGDFGKSWQKP